MKNFIRTCVLVALAFITTTSLAAESVHLMLKSSTGKVYTCKTDASGKFTFDRVEPGAYQLIWILPDGKSPDNTESASIDIQSFSWGATQMGSHSSSSAGRVVTATTTADADDDGDGVSSEKKATKSRSNIQNNRMINTSRSNIKSQRSAQDFKLVPGGGKGYCVVVLEDVVVSGLTDCPGTISGMAINEKGLPGGKGTKKGNK